MADVFDKSSIRMLFYGCKKIKVALNFHINRENETE